MCTAVDMKKENKSVRTTRNTRVSLDSVSLNIWKKWMCQQRCMIKFCVYLKKTPSETTALLKEAFGKEMSSDSTIRRWHKTFVDGRESAEFEPCGGVPRAVVTVTNINTVAAVIKEDQHPTVQAMSG